MKTENYFATPLVGLISDYIPLLKCENETYYLMFIAINNGLHMELNPFSQQKAT